MPRDTDQIVEHHRLALLRVLAGLFAMAGIEPGVGVADVLPRCVKYAIFKVLRQAESAGRRLIFAKAREMEIPAYVPRDKRAKSASNVAAKKARTTRIPQFRLIDPRKFLEELFPNRKARRAGKRRKRRTEPVLLFRIAGFGGQPDYEAWSDVEPELTPDDPLNAVPISRRMQALFHALSDLDKQAQRMVREIAKRKAAKPGPASVPPLRYRLPPGHRKKHIHEVDAILQDCHWLAFRESPSPAKREPAPPEGV